MSAAVHAPARLKATLPIAAGVLVIAMLVGQVTMACHTYKWVDWEALYGRPHPVATFIHDWHWIIEVALVIAALGMMRFSRSLAFWVMAIPQILMTQALQTAYVQAIWFSHGHIYVDGREVPSHVNPRPAPEGNTDGKE